MERNVWLRLLELLIQVSFFTSHRIGLMFGIFHFQNYYKFFICELFVITAPGLGNYVEALVQKGGAEFQVFV